MNKKELENIILEAYTEALSEVEMTDTDSPVQWKDLSPKVQKHFTNTISYKGKAAPGDPERDFISSRKNTYFFTTNVDKTTELMDGIGHKGLLLIPEILDQEIKNNLDFYIQKVSSLLGLGGTVDDSITYIPYDD